MVAIHVTINEILIKYMDDVIRERFSRGIGDADTFSDCTGEGGFSCSVVAEEIIDIGRKNLSRGSFVAGVVQYDFCDLAWKFC